MISRVAENCFWMMRYIERAETTARLASVNRMVILDAEIHDAQRWKPIIIVLGEQERFEQHVGVKGYDSDKDSEEYITWSEDNPASIRSSLAGARENARMTREVISREMWETINTAWQWFNGPQARKLYRADKEEFHLRVRAVCAEFQGDCHNTMLHDEPFDFMQLGLFLERAGQTARVTDVKRHWLTPGPRSSSESPTESAQWAGILRLCAAVEPFFKRHTSAATGPLVASFLLQDPGFPRSVVYSIDQVAAYVERIGRIIRRKTSTPSLKLARSVSTQLRALDLTSLSTNDLHRELTQIVNDTAGISSQLYADFFHL